MLDVIQLEMFIKLYWIAIKAKWFRLHDSTYLSYFFINTFQKLCNCGLTDFRACAIIQFDYASGRIHSVANLTWVSTIMSPNVIAFKNSHRLGEWNYIGSVRQSLNGEKAYYEVNKSLVDWICKSFSIRNMLHSDTIHLHYYTFITMSLYVSMISLVMMIDSRITVA